MWRMYRYWPFRMLVRRNVSGGSVRLLAVAEFGKDLGEARNGYVSPLDATKIKNLLLWVGSSGCIFSAAVNQNYLEQNTPHNKNV